MEWLKYKELEDLKVAKLLLVDNHRQHHQVQPHSAEISEYCVIHTCSIFQKGAKKSSYSIVAKDKRGITQKAMAILFEGEHSVFSIGLEAIRSALLTTFQKSGEG